MNIVNKKFVGNSSKAFIKNSGSLAFIFQTPSLVHILRLILNVVILAPIAALVPILAPWIYGDWPGHSNVAKLLQNITYF